MATKSTSAAGMPLALAIVVGAVAGGMLHQPTIGVLAGVAVGTALAIAVWLVDRRRTGG